MTKAEIIERMARAIWKENEDEISFDEALKRGDAIDNSALAYVHALAEAAYAACQPLIIEQCAEVADDEPCMEGDCPAHVLEAMEEVGPIENARSACRATKKSIATAIRALKEERETDEKS